MYEAKKIVASICHGPWVLISAAIVKGKRATCYPGMKDDLVNAGGIYTNEPVVIDGNLITGDRPQTSGFWVNAIVEALKISK
jgi:protease I